VTSLDETHRADLRSWVDSANDPTGDFPIQNLPFGVFRDASGAVRGGVAIRFDSMCSMEAPAMLHMPPRAAA
jgi:fumarylacetoacetase